MRTTQQQTLLQLNREIAEIARLLPPGKYHQVVNRVNKANLIIKKSNTTTDMANATSKNYNASREILNALIGGRKLSQLDCKEFMVADMRTMVSHLKPHFPDTHVLVKKWIVTPVNKRHIRQYQLVDKTSL